MAPSKPEGDDASESSPSVGANLESVTSLICSNIEVVKSDSMKQQLNRQVLVGSKENR